MDQRQMWIEEALVRFFGLESVEVAASAGGMNNTTVKVTVKDQDYILRLYNTHQDLEKAEFEHAVLRRLCGGGLSFRVPEPVPPLEGGSVVSLHGGKLAAVFRFIEGVTPDFCRVEQAEAFGSAAGELVMRMGCMMEELADNGVQPAYPPYYELGTGQGAYSLENAAEFCGAPPADLACYLADLDFLAKEIGQTAQHTGGLRKLPHQLIHGDLNASNSLAHPGGLAGKSVALAALLDFEFATLDLRAMEPAVCLWGLVPSGKGPVVEDGAEWAALEAFWRGFCGQVELTPEEREAVPLLMQLRSLDVFLHFLGRYQDGVEDSRVLAEQIPETAARMRWVARNRERLLELVRS